MKRNVTALAYLSCLFAFSCAEQKPSNDVVSLERTISSLNKVRALHVTPGGSYERAQVLSVLNAQLQSGQMTTTVASAYMFKRVNGGYMLNIAWVGRVGDDVGIGINMEGSITRLNISPGVRELMSDRRNTAVVFGDGIQFSEKDPIIKSLNSGMNLTVGFVFLKDQDDNHFFGEAIEVRNFINAETNGNDPEGTSTN